MNSRSRAYAVDDESSPTSSASPVTPTTPSQEPIILPTIPQTTTPLLSDTVLSTGKKRKPSTAERRANHNAVERARRETLNERFLDLAKLIPSISAHRKPSKSLIVNSSIAYVHASRRHRALASREIKTLQSEADHLRKELNEWRDRAGVKRLEEPRRSEGFGMVARAELPLDDNTHFPEDDTGEDQYDEGEEQPASHQSDPRPSPMISLPPSPPYHTPNVPHHPRSPFEPGLYEPVNLSSQPTYTHQYPYHPGTAPRPPQEPHHPGPYYHPEPGEWQNSSRGLEKEWAAGWEQANRH